MQIDPRKPNFESPIHYGYDPEPNSVTLSYVILTRFPNGMPEEFMAIIMRDILRALSFLHSQKATDHNDLNSSNVSVNTERAFTAIKIVLDPDKNFAHDQPRFGLGFIPTDGIWGLGTIALEMAYGSLPRNWKRKSLLVSLADNVVKILKLKLYDLDEEGKEKTKNELESADDQALKEKAMQKGKGKLVIADDQELREKAMQKGKGKLVNADDQELREKAMQKGKGTLRIDDDPKGKGKATRKGKEKSELADDPKGKAITEHKGKEKLETADDQKGKEMAKKKGEEVKKLTIKLPALEKLMNVPYVEKLEKKLIKEKEEQEKKKKKKFMAGVKEKFKAINFFDKKNNAGKRKFSRDFLEVLLMCLDEQKRSTAEQILAHPFFQQLLDVPKFERSMR